ncbi:LolA family protein [Kitasatospora sp. KL5]|uniref:LolA family protein n=1 Tax=Kitasatospora sp. KL5 TaxID=3425125 RepID=UPI003D6FFEAF
MAEQEQQAPYRSGRRTLVRVAVPVAVVAAVAAGVGLVPALASDSGPSLPSVTAEQLVAKVLGSDTQALSGTVQVKADLGVPSQLLGAAGGVGSGGTGGAEPQAKLAQLLGGQHTLQVAVDGPDRQRIGLVENLAGYELVHNGRDVWAWDSSSNEAVHLTAPQGGAEKKAGLPSAAAAVTPQEAAKQFLAFASGSTTVAVDGTTTVAGRDAYRLTLTPKGHGSTIARVRIAVDAERGVPLSVQATAVSGGPVLDVHYSKVSFDRPAASAFSFTPPKGAKVTEHKADEKAAAKAEEHGAAAGRPSAGDRPDVQVTGEGWTTVVSTRLPSGEVPAQGGKHGGKSEPQSALSMVKAFGKPVGGGTLIGTKVLNVLVTDDGRVFAGAVTLPVLQSAAGVK